MMRSAILLLTLGVLLAGCGAPTRQRAPFEGHWRKYEDEHGGFVEFTNGQMTLGDKSDSRSGPYSFSAASEEEPLYRVDAELPGGKRSFQLYYERDTISLIGDDEKVAGLYEIIVELAPIDPH